VTGKSKGMATTRRRFDVPRAAVWQALSDGHVYSRWVVGTSQIRDVDAGWPAPGTALHYSIGRGPLRHDGHTQVRAVDEGKRLELEAHAWPFGSIHIEIRIEEGGEGAGAGCVVTIVEHPARGAAARLHNPVGDALLKLRNVEALRRLERIAKATPPPRQ